MLVTRTLLAYLLARSLRDRDLGQPLPHASWLRSPHRTHKTFSVTVLLRKVLSVIKVTHCYACAPATAPVRHLPSITRRLARTVAEFGPSGAKQHRTTTAPHTMPTGNETFQDTSEPFKLRLASFRIDTRFQ